MILFYSYQNIYFYSYRSNKTSGEIATETSTSTSKSSKKQNNQTVQKSKNGETNITSLEDEFVLDEYEAFDDYLEMVNTFLYILLSTYPIN